MAPTKVVVTTGHRSSDEEGTQVRRTIQAEQDVELSLSAVGDKCNPHGIDFLSIAFVRYSEVVWGPFNGPADARVSRVIRREEDACRKRYTGRWHRLQSV